jgi:hypothetical protein
MTIENARWVDEEKTTVEATVDGKQLFVPAVSGNRHYLEIIAQGINVSDPI